MKGHGGFSTPSSCPGEDDDSGSGKGPQRCSEPPEAGAWPPPHPRLRIIPPGTPSSAAESVLPHAPPARNPCAFGSTPEQFGGAPPPGLPKSPCRAGPPRLSTHGSRQGASGPCSARPAPARPVTLGHLTRVVAPAPPGGTPAGCPLGNSSSYPTRQNPVAAAPGDLGPSTLNPRAPIMASLLFALPGRPPPVPSAPLGPSSLPAYTSPPTSLARCPARCHPARGTGGLDPERPISTPQALTWGLHHTPSSQPHLQMSKPRQKAIRDDQSGTGMDSPVQRVAGDGGWHGAAIDGGNGGQVSQILETALLVFALNRRNVGSEAGQLLCHSWGLPVA